MVSRNSAMGLHDLLSGLFMNKSIITEQGGEAGSDTNIESCQAYR